MGYMEADPSMSFRQAADKIAAVAAIVKDRVIGQDQVIDTSLASMIAGGHVLYQGYPGVAKTRLAETLGAALGLATKKVQYGPDTMPADILGKDELKDNPDSPGAARWTFVPGPIHTQILHADELNRGTSRVHAALLEGMQKGFVTVGGQPIALPEPFLVLGTQNPHDHFSTHALPEPLLDRFSVCLDVDSIGREHAERLFMMDLDDEDLIQPQLHVLDEDSAARALPRSVTHEFQLVQQAARRLPIAEPVMRYALDICRKARADDPSSPKYIKDNFNVCVKGERTSQDLKRLSRAVALMKGKNAVEMEDVRGLVVPVFGHRMTMSRTSQNGPSTGELLLKLANDR